MFPKYDDFVKKYQSYREAKAINQINEWFSGIGNDIDAQYNELMEKVHMHAYKTYRFAIPYPYPLDNFSMAYIKLLLTELGWKTIRFAEHEREQTQEIVFEFEWDGTIDSKSIEGK